MPTIKCENCGSGVDITKDGEWGHCASCNTVCSLVRVSWQGD